MTVIKPPRLRKGSIIGLIAPASTPAAEENIERGAAYLEHLGYRVKLGMHIRRKHGYLAGTDEERAQDFNAMVCDKDVNAIFTIRGGYGTPRILRMIDYRSLKHHPKIIVGYSDITALQLAILRKIGLVTFSGPMTGVEMSKGMAPYTEEHFWRLLTSTKTIGPFHNPAGEPWRILNDGKAQGQLIGGNFSLLACLFGTPFIPELRKSILILEDVDEAPHRLDRMLAQLLNTGVLQQLNGLVFGKFTDCRPSDPKEPHLTIDQILEEYTAQVQCPVIANVRSGHTRQRLTVPLGLSTILDTKRNRIAVMENAVV